ncbi:hypothetical protein BP6252_13918 [Coleophoma cylindrospora]|uniref:Uncharacterized protein n=1 Tax=Coleophoma cylindrospora TaxID=1849047 RepID=A0A3D8Q5Q5_9HELO|nr:hypothetical protein BP6252_13918 [Coleophoma cylindrospora]
MAEEMVKTSTYVHWAYGGGGGLVGLIVLILDIIVISGAITTQADGQASVVSGCVLVPDSRLDLVLPALGA